MTDDMRPRPPRSIDDTKAMLIREYAELARAAGRTGAAHCDLASPAVRFVSDSEKARR